MTDSSMGEAEPRSRAAGQAPGVELDHVRATLEVLHGAAALLQGAVEQRESLLLEIATAEQALAEVLQKHLRAEHALSTTQEKLERTTREVELAVQLRSEVGEFDKMVDVALARRGALVQEIVELEQRREALQQTVALTPAPVAYTPPAPALAPSPILAASPPAAPAPTAAPPAALPVAVAPMAASPILAAAPRVPSPILAAAPPLTAAPQPHPSPTVTDQLAAATTFVAAHRPQIHLPGLPRRLAPRQIATIALGTLLLGLAILLTPVSQVFGGLQLLAVMSGSMEPTINVGGIVGIRPVPANELRVGDVITFANQSAPDVLVTHRIVSVENRDGQSFLTTKGDANDAVDAMAAPATRAVGRVDFSLPWLGFVMMWLSSPLAKVAILAVSIVGFALPGAFKRSAESDTTHAPVSPAVAAPAVALPAMPAPTIGSSSYTSLEQELEALLGSTNSRPAQAA